MRQFIASEFLTQVYSLSTESQSTTDDILDEEISFVQFFGYFFRYGKFNDPFGTIRNFAIKNGNSYIMSPNFKPRDAPFKLQHDTSLSWYLRESRTFSNKLALEKKNSQKIEKL